MSYVTHAHAALFLPAVIRTRRRVFYPPHRLASSLPPSCNDTNTAVLYATHTSALFLPVAIRTRQRRMLPTLFVTHIATSLFDLNYFSQSYNFYYLLVVYSTNINSMAVRLNLFDCRAMQPTHQHAMRCFEISLVRTQWLVRT